MEWNKKMNKKYMMVSIYVIVTVVIIYALSRVVNYLPFIVVNLLGRLGWLMKVSTPIILGFVISYLLNPIVNIIENKLGRIKIRKKGLKKARGLAVFAAILCVFLFLTAIISLLVYTVTDQIRLANFDDLFIIAESYKSYIDNLYNNAMAKLNTLDIQSDEITQYINTATTFVVNGIKSFILGTASGVTNISSYFTTFIFSFIIAIYFMLDGKTISVFLNKVGYALFSKKSNERVHQFLSDADTVFSGYVRGQLMDAFIMMIAIGVALSIVGVKFGLIIGVLAGIGNLIPYCGPVIAYISTIIVCLINGQMKELIIGCIVLLIIQTIDGNIIAPKLLSNSIEIHPVLVIIFLIFGSAIGGLLGMLLAVPVGALIKVLFVRFIDQRAEQKAIKEKAKE